MDQQQNIDFVLRTVEERGIRFVHLWFTDVLGRLKSFAISPEDLEVRLRGGRRLRRLCHRRIHRARGGRHARLPGPVHVPGASLASLARRRGPRVLRHSQARPHVFRGRSARVPASHVPQGGVVRIHHERRHGARILLLPRRPHARSHGRGGLLRSHAV